MDSNSPSYSRSMSGSDVFDGLNLSSSTSPRRKSTPILNLQLPLSRSTSSTLPASSEINANPQDFVVVNGQTFRVTRSPRYSTTNSLLASSTESLDRSSGINSNNNHSNNNHSNSNSKKSTHPSLNNCSSNSSSYNINSRSYDDTTLSLRQALDAAEATIIRNQAELSKQTKRIEELENTLIANGIQFPSSSYNSTQSLSSSTTVSSSGLAARRRAESRSIQVISGPDEENSPKKYTEKDVSKKSSSSLSSSAKINETNENVNSTVSPDGFVYITPTNADFIANQDTKPAPFSAPVTSKTLSSSMPGAGEVEYSSSASTPLSDVMMMGSKEPPRGLAARLAMGSKERRKIAAKRLKNLPKSNINNNDNVTDESDVDYSPTSSPPSSNTSTPIDSKNHHHFSSSSNTTISSSSSSKNHVSSMLAGSSSKRSNNNLNLLSHGHSPITIPSMDYGDDAYDSPTLGIVNVSSTPSSRSNSGRSVESKRRLPTINNDLYSNHNDSEASHSQFIWKSNDKEKDLYVFIAHDNPQLGHTISSQLATDSQGMHLMLESKEDNGVTCFLLAKIVYSGDVENVEDADLKNPRGSQFIVCSELQAIRADIKDFPTRTRGDILEIRIDGVPKECFIDVSDADKLKKYLKPCTARVDVILDPSHTDTWYPYWEGRRKMAPQFRSKGIGYIRLGDDMSRYGSAFLSLDAGVTYLDDGATSIVASESASSSTNNHGQFNFGGTGGIPSSNDKNNSSYYSTFPGNIIGNIQSIRNAGIDSTINSDPSTTSTLSSNRPTSTGIGAPRSAQGSRQRGRSASGGNNNAPTRNPRDIEELRDLLTILRDSELKWAERAETLRRLSACPGCGDSSHITEVISIVMDSITRQKNPHVLRAAVSCIRAIGESAAVVVSCGVAWRSLLLESIHLLRVASKPVYEEARDSLNSLHGRCLSLGYLSATLDDIFAGPRGKGSGGASNSAKVVQWLDIIAETEIAYNTHKLFTSALSLGGLDTGLLYERVDTAATFQRCRHLLIHREEATRDAAVNLVAHIVVYDIIQLADSSSLSSLIALPKKLKENSSAATIGLTIMRFVSTACAAVLAEVDKSSPRMNDRILASIAQSVILIIDRAVAITASASKSSPRSSTSNTYNSQLNPSPLSAAPSTAKQQLLLLPTSSQGSRPKSSSMKSKNISLDNGDDDNMAKKEGNLIGGISPRISSDLLLEKNKLNNKSVARPTSGVTASTASTNTSPSSTGSDSRGSMLYDEGSLLPNNSSLQKLSDSWFEVRLMLRVVPNTETAWRQLSSGVLEAHNFFSKLQSTSASIGMAQGALLRIVLPFDEDTSSNDQSKISTNSKNSYNNSAIAIDDSTLQLLREQAVNLRRLIRVKMADEADLQQAVTATKMLKNFCNDVESLSLESNTAPISLIKNIENTM